MNKVLIGDNLTWLKSIKSGVVQTCITSPPYWGLRDYGHESQMGLEETFDQWLHKMVRLFHIIKRVLRDDGTIWVNMGDSYLAQQGTGFNGQKRLDESNLNIMVKSHLPPKNLLGQPWRLAFALQADGWILRSDIIWAKPNPMPESCIDRPTKSHEYLFLMTKKPHYYYDADAIREETGENTHSKGKKLNPPIESAGIGHKGWHKYTPETLAFKNKRDVWTIPTESFSKAHFATFPKALVKPCILAGSSRICCSVCMKPHKKEVEKEYPEKRSINSPTPPGQKPQSQRWDHPIIQKTLGFSPDCECGTKETKPSLVLDPFSGTGTTGAVAAEYGRDYLGIELNPEYAKMRLEERSVQTFL